MASFLALEDPVFIIAINEGLIDGIPENPSQLYLYCSELISVWRTI